MALRTPLPYAALAAAVLLCGALRAAPPAPPATASAPREPLCAILVDPTLGAEERSAALLIEAELTQGGGARTVERGAIEQVIKEQQIQQLLGSDTASRRQALGRLLNADLLVLIGGGERAKDGPKDGPRLQLVISETSQGLRLCNVQLDPKTGDAVGGARQLIQAAAAAPPRVP